MIFLVVFLIWYNKLEDIEKRTCKEKKVWVSVVDVGRETDTRFCPNCGMSME